MTTINVLKEGVELFPVEPAVTVRVKLFHHRRSFVEKAPEEFLNVNI